MIVKVYRVRSTFAAYMFGDFDIFNGIADENFVQVFATANAVNRVSRFTWLVVVVDNARHLQENRFAQPVPDTAHFVLL